VSDEHLSDVALVEWARRRDVKLAPETRFRVEAHLARCDACRVRLAAHERLEVLCDPWFRPPDVATSASGPGGGARGPGG
jgi:anti-sigma factor RsiW